MCVLCAVCCAVLLCVCVCVCVCRYVLCWCSCWCSCLCSCWCAMCGAWCAWCVVCVLWVVCVVCGLCVCLTWLCACDVCCGVYVVLWCCVFCWWCVVWCVCVWLCVWCVWCVWCGAAWHAENRSVCRFKTPPCVRRPERTHGGVLNLHTEGFSAFSSLFSSLLSSLSLVLSSLSLALFPLLSSLFFSLSNNVNDHSSSALSLGTHGSNVPECQSACTLAHSLSGEHVRIMHETTVLVLLCEPRATWNEVGLYLCWKWVLCVVVLSCVVVSGSMW